MSVLIKGMEKPDHCLRCPVRGINDECLLQSVAANNEYETWTEQMANCPLVPIPPHGRLIDADALIERIGFEVRHYVVKDEFDKGRLAAWNNVIHAIREYAPTIIPASEEDK